MNSIQVTIVKLEEAIQAIKEAARDFYLKEDLGEEFENELAKLIEELDENLFGLIEYPYVDKVYRDSYYSYFASKHNPYPKDCIRISFFTSEIRSEHFRSEAYEKFLQESFVGYVVIRPTFYCPLGRSLLDKRAFAKHDFRICNYTGNVSVNGVKLKVNGFPHSSQDTESISCAETTIWSVMEYFGSRYPDYRPTYPSHIIDLLNKFSKQRLLPSNGLTVDEISFALKEFGFGTSIYSREDAYGQEIENIISYYVESGIPVIAAIENDDLAHAIAIIGHENDSKPDFKSVRKNRIEYFDEEIEYIDYTNLPKKYVVNDDNLAPYRTVDLGYPVEHYDPDGDFKGCMIESIVVPLYKKIYLEVIKARNLALTIISDSNFGFKFSKGFVFRFFLASSRSFKEHITRLPKMLSDQKDYLILAAMPKFIWCAEIYSQSNFGNLKADGLVILDATEANQVFIDSLLFAGYPDRLIIKNEGEFIPLKQPFGEYQWFKNNLQ